LPKANEDLKDDEAFDLDQDQLDDALNDSPESDQRKLDIEHFMANFESETKNVKKSFELKYEMEDEDDDAEVFIVHEEEENEEEQMEFDNKHHQDDQDELFVQGPSDDFKTTQTPQESAEVKESSPKSPTEGFEKIEMNVEDIENMKTGKSGN